MNAHSVVARDSQDCTPTKVDYDRFFRMTFLHAKAPLFGASDEVCHEPVSVVAPTTQPQRTPPPAEVMTTAKANNIAQPYLPTPPVVVAKKPAARIVSIAELMEIEQPERVVVAGREIQVEINPHKGPVFKVTSGAHFYVSRFEVCCLISPPTGRLSKETVTAFVSLHRDLRDKFLNHITQNARPFLPSATFLESLVAGQYVKAHRGRKSALFKVTGEKREKRLEYVTSSRSGLRVKFGTSIKIRRLQNGEPIGSPEEDKLLAYFQELYA